MPRRVEDARRAVAGLKLKWSWIIFCDGFSKLQSPASPIVRRWAPWCWIARRALATGQLFSLGAAHAKGAWALLCPKEAQLDPGKVRKMFSLSLEHPWVAASKLDFSPGLRTLRPWLGNLPADLGSLFLVDRKMFTSSASSYSPHEVLFGYRVFSRACSIPGAVAIAEDVNGDPAAALSPWRAFGLERKKIASQFMRGMERFFWGLIALLAGQALCGPEPALGLGLVAAGILILASLFGKPV